MFPNDKLNRTLSYITLFLHSFFMDSISSDIVVNRIGQEFNWPAKMANYVNQLVSKIWFTIEKVYLYFIKLFAHKFLPGTPRPTSQVFFLGN